MSGELICLYQIDDPTKYNSKEGKSLLSAFNLGPSISVVKNGSITVTDKGFIGNKDADTNKEVNNKEVNNKDSNECHSYSILGAFSRLSHIYEDDSSQENGDKESSNNDSSKENNSSTGKEEPRKELIKEFIPGNLLEVKVELPDNGYTVWTLATHKNMQISIKEFAGKLQSKNVNCFEKALSDASKGLGVYGVVPIKAETYLTNRFMPFLGHCRYAIGSGNVDNRYSSGNKDSGTESLTITVAVAPLDGASNNSPSEDTVYHSEFSVLNITNITGGKMAQLGNELVRKAKDKLNDVTGAIHGSDSWYKDKSSSTEKDRSEELNDFLTTKFQTPGDSSMYNYFLEIKNFIKQHESKGDLKFEESSEDYSNFKKGCTGRLIYY